MKHYAKFVRVIIQDIKRNLCFEIKKKYKKDYLKINI